MSLDETTEEKAWTPPKLSVVTGGLDGQIDSDWLYTKLFIGDVFLCKPNKSADTSTLHIWGIAYKADENGHRAVRLENPENRAEYKFVDSRDFSKYNTLWFVLPKVVESDEQRNRTD
jgi:hypothetical protein